MNICIFGDSTAWGAWDMEKGGWVNRLWFYLAEKDSEIMLYNLSISGGTTDTILERFENEANIRKAEALLFQSGGNDAAYEDGEPDNFRVSIGDFEKNLEEIIERGKKITDKIFFVGFKNVDESRSMPVSWADVYYANENILSYNDVFKRVCKKHNISFLDIYGILKKSDLEDGVHPNANGHEKIFEAVKEFLVSNHLIG